MSWALSEPQVQQAALLLGAPAIDVAFVRAEQGLYFARREAWPPLSPVLRLLCGIHELEPQCARWIVRNPVYATAAASASCTGASRLAGRRLKAGVLPVDHGLSFADVALIDAGAAAARPRRLREALDAELDALAARGPDRPDDAGWMGLAQAMTAAVVRAGADPASGRSDKPIAAVLVDDGDLLAWATHTGSRNATRHAELNLVESYMTRTLSRLPLGACIYSTLKPCRMCAGVIWDSAADPRTLQVVFAEEDAGRYARETVLDAGSAARQRAVAQAADASLRLQWQLGSSRA